MNNVAAEPWGEPQPALGEDPLLERAWAYCKTCGNGFPQHPTEPREYCADCRRIREFVKPILTELRMMSQLLNKTLNEFQLRARGR